ncbi:MAG: nitrite reductase large subunit NirB [Candidatus Tectimicrobiota bacterium]
MSGMEHGASQHKTVVVIGNGMVGQRFCEKLVEWDTQGAYRIVTFCEEPRAAYDRVGLTSFFAHRSAEKLLLAKREWYEEHGITLHLGDRASTLDRQKQVVQSDKGVRIAYDTVILATGSYPFVPSVPGIDKLGVFVYRTIEDLEKIMAYGKRAKRAAVIGGGLLGLEAAKAANDLGLETHVIEFAPRLMPRQIDEAGSQLLVKAIEALGVQVHLHKGTQEVLGQGRVQGMRFTDGSMIEVDMIIVSAGIRPRDELARACGLGVGERGGILVDERLQTSDPHIYAIGEVALYQGMIYGLVAPGWQMAEIVARNLTGGNEQFHGADLSTKLKLMGVDVASFGDYEAGPERARALTWEDPFRGSYKKLLFNHAGTHLLGGILVGEAHEYGLLAALAKGGEPLPCKPHELFLGKADGPAVLGGVGSLPDTAQICSCNNVTKGTICTAIREQELTSVAQVKACTRAGTGCGGCLPMVTDLFNAEMQSAGKLVSAHLCEHFAYSRTELFALVKARHLTTFDLVLAEAGSGLGCEICKPAVTSMLASLWNEHILQPAHQTLQDTNDRFLANMQRGGLYSIVPRVPGGEITPEKLIALGATARQFGLYTKITGAQRIDLFGAQLQDLPAIWEQLIAAGFESGHAYGKALRTVKSCVGTTWCRYGVQDSVGFAIRIENRYKGLRAPHKIKAAVSGCVRECAEAQSKDFGLVATERGYNLYVCGNGGARPRHADLLATDLDEDSALRYIDRFLMYYVMTADRLTRTAVWLDKLEGGLAHLKEVILEDKLGLCDELEAMMQSLVDSYQCEWATVLQDPDKRKWFRQFVNSEATEVGIEMVHERGQQRPGDWPSELVSLEQCKSFQAQTRPAAAQLRRAARSWVRVGTVADFPRNGGATIKYGQTQIAVFNFTSQGTWYACQQMCPHKKAFVLSRGIIGDSHGLPKVACPLHKKTFSLESGACLSGEDYTVEVFPVRVEGEAVYLELPPTDILDALLATDIGCHLATACDSAPEVLVEAP